MNDDMIKKLGENGGVIQINFGSSFLDGNFSKRRDSLRNAMNEMLAREGLESKDAKAKPLIEQFKKDNPVLFADVHTVADHIDHVVSLAGVDHVGIGSDYDGVGDSLPTGLKDVSHYPNLIAVLMERGYSDADIEKICWGNVRRVWSEVLTYAQSN